MASTTAATASSSSYLCDTLPPPRLASQSMSRPPTPPPGSPSSSATSVFGPSVLDNSALQLVTKPDMPSVQPDTRPIAEQSQPPPRKLCVRHQRMADEGTSLKLQQALDALPVEEREAVNAVWSNFSSSPHPRRALILQGLLTMCCFSQLSLLSDQLSHLIRLDPFAVIPREVSLKILGYLDATSLCRAAQVSRQWKSLADDDILWRGICEQHIGQKCLKCGWGLPILEKRRAVRLPSTPSSPPPFTFSQDNAHLPIKRDLPSDIAIDAPASKRRRRDDADPEFISDFVVGTPLSTPFHGPEYARSASPTLPPDYSSVSSPSHVPTRPWKDVYCERLRIERNWRRGRCTVRTLKGHTDGVMCLQFDETLSHPAFPVLITGSYDRTARVWNLETGTEVHCLTGHTRAVRALQFDEVKLITGSMDHTMRVWNWRTGQCLRTLEGHTEGVVCLNFDSTVLASGSVDATIKVWNLKTAECFTLRGHCDWVNAVQLWDVEGSDSACSAKSSMLDHLQDEVSASSRVVPHVDRGKMLFSASDDGTIRLWDLAARTCVQLFKGHVGQVQSLKLLVVDQEPDTSDTVTDRTSPSSSTNSSPLPSAYTSLTPTSTSSTEHVIGTSSSFLGVRSDASEFSSASWSHLSQTTASAFPDMKHDGKLGMPDGTKCLKRQKRVLISGSLDNTIKLWDIDTGKAVRTLFGHIEGVWAVASDKLRLVSGSHDRTIKVWEREDGRCTATLVGHRGAVTCLGLGEDKIVSGGDDGDIRIWNFCG